MTLKQKKEKSQEKLLTLKEKEADLLLIIHKI